MEKGVALDHSASSIEFTSIGTSEIVLNGSRANPDNAVYFTVYIDGERQSKRVCFNSADNSELIVSGLSLSREYTVKLVRETEESYGAFTANSLCVDYFGALGTRLPDKKLYIEFIGDSITSGLGSQCGYLSNDGSTVSDTQGDKCTVTAAETPFCEDATASYAYFAAETLNADRSFVSYSGIGVAKGYADFTMSDYYTYASKSRNVKYDFSTARIPDLVVINLGTNDCGLNADTDTFKAAVKNLINQVRDAYGKDVKILWATGLMGDAYKDYTSAAISELNNKNVYHFTGLTEGRGGHNGHPTKAQAEAAAKELVSYIVSNGILADKETALADMTNVPDGYKLVWYDGFSTSAIDYAKWTQTPSKNASDLIYTKGENNLTVRNGNAVMSAKSEGDGTYTANQSLTTRDRMAFKYGYLEMKAKVPFGAPSWASFWLQSNPVKDGTIRKAEYFLEVDAFEIFASPTKMVANIHKWYPGASGSHQANGGKADQFTHTFASQAEAEQYHVYAIKWTPEMIEFFVDGHRYAYQDINDDFQVAGRENNITGLHDYLYILLNSGIFTPGLKEQMPTFVKDEWVAGDNVLLEYEVDYIRLFQSSEYDSGIYFGTLPQ